MRATTAVRPPPSRGCCRSRRRATTPHFQRFKRRGDRRHARGNTGFSSVYSTPLHNMSSPSDNHLPVPLLLYYNSIRQRNDRTDHERHVAFMESANIRTLPRVPEAFVASSRLSPSFPPHPVHFTAAVHQQLLTDDSDFSTPLTCRLPSSHCFIRTCTLAY